MKRAGLFFLIFFILIHFVRASDKKDYYFRHLNTENGLSQNTVLCILQDKTGYMWFGTKGGLNRYDGNSVKIFKMNEGDSTSLGNNTVLSLLEMPDGKIWAGTDRGIYVYDPSTETFHFLDAKNQHGRPITGGVIDMKLDKNGNVWIAGDNLLRYSMHTGKVEIVMHMVTKYNPEKPFRPRTRSINIDKDGQIWFAIFNDGIRKYNPIENNFNHYTKDSDGKDLVHSQVATTINLDNNHLLIGLINHGLKIMDKTTNTIHDYTLDKNIDQDRLLVRTLEKCSDGNIWIGTESGLYIHNPESNKTQHLYHNTSDRYSLSDNAIYSIYEDREGGIWVGTYFGGVNYFPRPYSYFKNYYPIKGQNSISGERISGICEDTDGNLWIGTEDAGLNKLNIKTQLFEHFDGGKYPNGLNYSNVHDIVPDGDLLWIATFSHGINVLNLKTKKWKYYLKGLEAGMLNNNDIFALFKDSSNRIWVGTSTGAFIFDRKTETFIPQEQLRNFFISDIIEDAHGQVWFTTHGSGVHCYNLRTKEHKNYTYSPDDVYTISSRKLNSMFLDSKKRLWFATESGGICMFDDSTERFIRYGIKDGFSSNDIHKILEDNDSNLWLSSNMGIMRFNPETKQIRIFTQNNGLPGNQFNYKSGYKDKSGNIYFGSLNGLISFNPNELISNNYIPPVVITDFSILNGSTPSKIKYDADVITLKYNQASFSIDFAALSYVAPEMNRYAYKMEGLDRDWTYLSSQQKIIYSNLPHGKYTFKVKASNNDGVWNNEGKQLEINILPPFWKTIWAYIIYGILFLSAIFLFSYYYKKRVDQRNKRKQIVFENRKEKEIYDAKIEFFTNVAHEVRTPLTLIKGPLEYILNNDVKEEELSSNLHIMEKNTDRLLSLINQLLDFRKTESKGFSITFVRLNINELLKETYTRFYPLTEQKSLKFNISVPDSPIFADVDKEAVIKIVSNLFTNAIKYAQSVINVNLTDKNQAFEICVNSDGDKIPENLKEKIYEPFYQIQETDQSVKSGSGIGLALVKSLVELHAGSTYLDINIAESNSFVVLLPKNQRNTINIASEQYSLPKPATHIEDEKDAKPKKLPSVLVVEDNEELLLFITDKLNKQYAVFGAKNGIDALAILKKEQINLIISDIIMPQMNGLELTSKVKEDMEYSHIPIILLTAKTNIQSKITGLESGADAYIEKPFSIEHLQAQISSLLYNRKKVREAFSNSPFIHTNSIALTKADEQFLNKLTDIIYKNIANPDFNVDQLAEELFMSRSSLLRKIKGVSDFTPNDFIRLIRLKRAAEILQEGEYKVNEVCYLVGFMSTSYFSKAFQKQFGVLPKDFVKNSKK